MVEEVEEVEEKMENQENESPVKKGGELRTETENFRELFEKSLKKISEHAIVKGTVIRITDSDVIVDIGSKSEGVISKNEFFDKRKNLEVEVGDVISIYLEKTEDDSGAMVLSYEKALQIQAWDKITEALKENTPITGVITGAVKGGFTVDIGFKAFLPGSLADINFTKNMNEYIGKTFQFKVIKCDRKTLNILISRKAFLEEERKGNREKLLETLKEGDIVKGKVKSFASYGAFIDIGGVDALLHNKEISWGKINKPEDVLKIGDKSSV